MQADGRGLLVVVPGAGLAGLVAGAAGGARNTVMESSPVGGRACTHIRDAVQLNQGPHALYRDGPGNRVLSRREAYLADLDQLSASLALTQMQSALSGISYLDGGWQPLVRGLPAAVSTVGAEIRDHARPERLSRRPGAWEMRTTSTVIRAAAEIVAVARPAAAGRLLPAFARSALGRATGDPLPPSSAADAAGRSGNVEEECWDG